jgi:hypothetical protein
VDGSHIGTAKTATTEAAIAIAMAVAVATTTTTTAATPTTTATTMNRWQTSGGLLVGWCEKKEETERDLEKVVEGRKMGNAEGGRVHPLGEQEVGTHVPAGKCG